MKNRCVVTGMGIVSSLGNDVDIFYDKLLSGESGISNIEKFSVDGYATKIAAEIKEFDSTEYIDPKQARRIDDFVAYAMVAGKKALEYAKVEFANLVLERCGIIIGSGMGGMGNFASGLNTLLNKGPRRLTPFFVPYILTNIAGGSLAIDLGFKGPNYSISTACATANNCIISAADYIRSGQADVMLCGGTEAALCPIGLAGFIACKALSQNNENPEMASRPWDKNRNGFVIGEGSGVLVLESLEHAKKRGAKILAEYLGGGISCDAYHITDPSEDGSGARRSMELALSSSGISSDNINYINAHATSTIAGDLIEIKALKALFGERKDLYINATKSMIGHSLGAAGGIEAIATVKAIELSQIHPTVNLNDPEKDIECFNISSSSQNVSVEAAMTNSFGFGGHNASVIFAPYSE